MSLHFFVRISGFLGGLAGSISRVSGVVGSQAFLNGKPAVARTSCPCCLWFLFGSTRWNFLSCAGVSCVLLMVTTLPAPAETVVLQNGLGNDVSDGFECIADTLISEDSSSANAGSAAALGVGNMQNRSGGNRRISTLMRFNLSPLAGATVTGPARLSLSQVNTSGGTGDSTFDFHVFAVSEKNADWIDGTGKGSDGEEASADETTWKFKAFPGTSWAGAPGLTEPGIDFEAEPVATVTYKESDGVDHPVEIQLPASLIQKWIDHPETNGGILLAWQSGDRYLGMFRSSQYWVPAQRPKLRVDYKK